MSNQWVNLGTFRVSTTGKRHLVIDKGIEIFYNGEKVNLDQFRSAKCFDSLERLEGLKASGRSTDEKIEAKRSYINDKNIKFDVVIPPATSGE